MQISKAIILFTPTFGRNQLTGILRCTLLVIQYYKRMLYAQLAELKLICQKPFFDHKQYMNP